MPPAKSPTTGTGWPSNRTNLLANTACRQPCTAGYSGSLVTRCFANATWAPGFRGNCTRGEERPQQQHDSSICVQSMCLCCCHDWQMSGCHMQRAGTEGIIVRNQYMNVSCACLPYCTCALHCTTDMTNLAVLHLACRYLPWPASCLHFQ
jgi:hypothetical protein